MVAGEELQAQRTRWLGCLYAVAAVLSGVTPLVPHGPGYNGTGLVAVTAVAGVIAVVFLAQRRAAGDLVVHLAVVLAALLTTAEIRFTAGLPNAATLFYIWIVLFAFYFFSTRAAIGHLGLVVVLYVLSALWTDAPYPLAAHTIATLGAFVGCGVIVAALKRRIETLITMLVETARTDPLTGLPNRRAFDEEIARTLARARRSEETITLAALDLDHFKAVNDQLGHPAGDAVLQRFAELLRETIRDGDFAARIGGEEFAVLVSSGSGDGAVRLAHRIVVATRAEFAGDEPPVTVSVGLAASTPRETLASEELMRRADEAMYDAKRAGRDRVVAHAEGGGPEDRLHSGRLRPETRLPFPA